MSFLSLSLSIPIPLLGHHHPPPLSQPAGGAPHPSSGSPCSSTSGFYSKTFGLLGETGPDKQTYMYGSYILYIWFFSSPCYMMTFFSYLSYLWVDLPYTSSVIPPDAFFTELIFFQRVPAFFHGK